jgi:predicted GNAT family N-acyltransferase
MSVKSFVYKVEDLSSDDDLYQLLKLRTDAWQARTNSFSTDEYWAESLDASAMHFVIRCPDLHIIAAARLSQHHCFSELPNGDTYAIATTRDQTFGVISRLVVSGSHAGKGLASLLDKARIEKARSLKLPRVFAATSIRHRVSMLEKAGFRQVGEGAAYNSGPLASLSNRHKSDGMPSELMSRPVVLELDLAGDLKAA